MWLTHKLVELQGISGIFLSRTAGFLNCKNKLLGWRSTLRRIRTFLICKLPSVLVVAGILYMSVLEPLLIDGGPICHSSWFLLLFLTVVTNIWWIWFWQKWGHLHVRAKPLLTAGRSTFAHLGRWPHSLVSITESYLNALIHLSVPVSRYFICHVVFLVYDRILSTHTHTHTWE